MNERIGILGGSFNPIHCGHLHIAAEVRKVFSLARVFFVVATTPPHKDSVDLINFNHRYAMVSLATAGIPSFIPSMIELQPPASAYSIDTMEKLALYAGAENKDLFFIAGGDSLAEVKTWRESARLLASYNFVFATRPGTGPVRPEDALPPGLLSRVDDLTGLSRAKARRIISGRSGEERIFVINVGAPDISATRIRRLASAGKPFRRLIPGPVHEYIRKLNLYGE